MRIPKRYGESRIDRCPFCDQQATTLNRQQIPVCHKHRDSVLNEMKCLCGGFLELKSGKYGVYFNCIDCGNMNLKKVIEINEVKDVAEQKTKRSSTMAFKKSPAGSSSSGSKTKVTVRNRTWKKETRKEIVITSDDPIYFR